MLSVELSTKPALKVLVRVCVGGACVHVCAKIQTQVPGFLSSKLFIFSLLLTQSLMESKTQFSWPSYDHSTYSAANWGERQEQRGGISRSSSACPLLSS